LKRKPPKLPSKRVWALYRHWLDLPPTPQAEYTLDVQVIHKRLKRNRRAA